MSPSAPRVSVGRSVGRAEPAELTALYAAVALTEEAQCPVCATSVPVEAPLCLDGHGPDCPERLCTQCGSALLVHALLSVGPASGSGRRPSARRAA